MIGPEFAATVAAAAAGDEAAFAVLWRDLNPPVRRYLVVAAPGWADDLASETWLDVVRGLRRFRGDEQGFRAWVFTIARHRALDWARREASRPAVPVAVEDLLDRAGTDDTADAALEAVSTAGALALLARLPPDQAEVVSLRVIAGLDVARVAEVTGRRPGTVRVLAHRGLRRLAAGLGRVPGVLVDADGASVVARLRRGRLGGKAEEEADIGNIGDDDNAAGRLPRAAARKVAERVGVRRQRSAGHALTPSDAPYEQARP